MNKPLFTAIVFFLPGSNSVPVMKYRKISSIDNFMRFASGKYPGMISSVNFYNRETRQFYKQIKPS
jgi:hypothetical protein